MKVSVISEHGYNEAMLGLGLSFGKTSGIETLYSSAASTLRDEMFVVANRLAGRGNGHDKFLRMISVWLDIDAPLYWWKQMDTYKVGTVAQSESTMHTLVKRPFDVDMFDFPNGPDATACNIVDYLNELRDQYLENREKKYWDMINGFLPQSFRQRRIVSANYAVIRNIITQRKGHKLAEWEIFIDAMNNGLTYPTWVLPND
jgi:hypothetical protein